VSWCGRCTCRAVIAARHLPPPSRSAFLRAVAERLGADFGDGDVNRAVRAALAALYAERRVRL
jgi:hypothetical protein